MKKLNPEHKQDAFEAKRLMIELFAAQSDFKVSKKRVEDAKKNIVPTLLDFMKNMRKEGVTKLSFKIPKVDEAKSLAIADNMLIEVKRVTRHSIVFDADALEKAIGWLAEDCIEKEYFVVDIERMKELMKSHGVSATDFRKLVSVKKTVNNKKLDDLAALGEISKADLEGTYEVVPVGEYLQTKLVQEQVDDEETGGEKRE